MAAYLASVVAPFQCASSISSSYVSHIEKEIMRSKVDTYFLLTSGAEGWRRPSSMAGWLETPGGRG